MRSWHPWLSWSVPPVARGARGLVRRTPSILADQRLDVMVEHDFTEHA